MSDEPDEGAVALLPRANPILLGQAAAEEAFLKAWQSRRLAHAWLLHGSPGIGKATLAYRIARFALAPETGRRPAEGLALPEDDPVFRRVAAASHADMVTLECAYDEKRGRQRSEIVVEDVRAAGQFLRLTPLEGGWRVVVVDTADALNANAANALLKILEEPPARALLLLVSNAPGRLLPTIRSRCRLLPLRDLEAPVLDDLLVRYLPEAVAEDRRALASLAEGSIGRALGLVTAGGLELYRTLLDMLGRLPDVKGAEIHGLADRIAKGNEGDRFATATELLLWWLGRMIRPGAGGIGAPEAAPAEAAVMGRLLASASLDQWIGLWDKIGRLVERAEAVSLDRKQVIVSTFLELGALTDRGGERIKP